MIAILAFIWLTPPDWLRDPTASGLGRLGVPAIDAHVRPMSDSDGARQSLEALRSFGPVLAIKLYRLTLEPTPAVPILPCLDHEAMLHESVAPHAAAYVQDASSGDLHELVFIPASRRIEVDTVSTWGENSAAVAPAPADDARRALSRPLGAGEGAVLVARRTPCGARLPRPGVAARRPARPRHGDGQSPDRSPADDRVADGETVARRVVGRPNRDRTVLAAAAFVLFAVFGFLTPTLGEGGVTSLRYALISVLGAIFLYYGMKAVQLTEMSNRVWKRTAEYQT